MQGHEHVHYHYDQVLGEQGPDSFVRIRVTGGRT